MLRQLLARLVYQPYVGLQLQLLCGNIVHKCGKCVLSVMKMASLQAVVTSCNEHISVLSESANSQAASGLRHAAAGG